MSCWKLFIDDIRNPPDDSYAVARSVIEAQLMISFYGMPNFISFDHDLGIDESGDILPSGYDLAKWIVEMDMNGAIVLSDSFDFTIHSMNPIGAGNIRAYLDNYLTLKHIHKR